MPPPTCLIEPDTLNFGNVEVGNFAILSFDITNTGYGLLSGTVSESCGDYTIISTTTYALTHDQTHEISILFSPTCGLLLGSFHRSSLGTGPPKTFMATMPMLCFRAIGNTSRS